MDESGGIPWVLIHIGWIVLAIALVYGIVRSRRMNARERSAQQQQARENFRVDEDSA